MTAIKLTVSCIRRARGQIRKFNISRNTARVSTCSTRPPKFIGRNLTFETQLMMQFLFHIMTSFEWTEIKQTQLYFSPNVHVICNLRWVILFLISVKIGLTLMNNFEESVKRVFRVLSWLLEEIYIEIT